MNSKFACLVALLLLAACSAPAASPSTTAHETATQEVASAAAEPSASEDPLAVCEGVEPEGEPLEIEVDTVSYAFDTQVIEGPTHCQPFVIVFTNSEPPSVGVNLMGTNEHNITIRAENLIGALLFDGEVIGRETIRYEVPGLPAGTHYFYCKLHSSMNGDVVIARAAG